MPQATCVLRRAIRPRRDSDRPQEASRADRNRLPRLEPLEGRWLFSAVSFQTQRTFAVGTYPDAVAVADLGNGHADLVVANGHDNTVGVLLGNGDGSFQPQQTLATGSEPDAVALADLGNGHPDLVVANFFGSTVSVLLGNGNGTFQARRDFATGSGSTSVAVADLGNGHPDLVVANSDDRTVSVLLGDGDGTFHAQQTFAVGAGADSVAVADLGNGRPDLVVSNRDDNTVSVLLGNGDGTFQAQHTFATGNSPNAVAVADLGNGHPDIVVANSGDNTAGVLLGKGDGTFQPQQAFPTGSRPYDLAVADFGNGHPDVVVVNESDNTVGVLQGNGDGTFQAQTTFRTDFGPVALAVADLGNGRPDLITANSSGDDVSVLLAAGATLSTTTLSSSLNPSAPGNPVTFTATVAAAAGSASAPTGSVTFFDGSAPVGPPVTLAGGVATLSTSDLPAGTDPITAEYSGDPTFSSSTSSVVSQSVGAAQPSGQNLSATLAGSVPPSVIAGAPLKLKETLILKAIGGAARGTGSATVLLSPSPDATESVLTLASVRSKLNLKAGKGKTFHLKLPKAVAASVLAGTYDVLIRLTDTAGVASTINSGQTLTVVAPKVDLTGSIVKVPATAKAGKKTSFTFLVTNSPAANVAAVGTLPFAIGASPDGNASDAVLLASGKKRINLKPGKSVRITLATTFKSSTYLIVRVDPDNTAFGDDVNFGNNTFAPSNRISVA